MGIETMGVDRTQYRKRRRTMDELDASEMTEMLTVYCLKQGVMRGVLYGAAYGLLFMGYGAIIGAGYGLIAGIAAGLFNGGILSAINARQRESTHEERYFLRKAANIGPPLTAITCYIVFHTIGDWGVNKTIAQWWEPDYISDIIPCLIAALAAWQATKRMQDWYFE